MPARMQELLRLLALVVDRVRAANERAERAEGQCARMAALLDAMHDENTALRDELDEGGAAAAEAQADIRALRAEVEAVGRLNAVLEERVAEAELRILRAAEALGLPAPNIAFSQAEEARHATALH